MNITLWEANQTIRGALSQARLLSVRVSVSVCDVYGHLIAHQRMDSASSDSSWDSIGKAIAAAAEGRPSGALITEFERFPRTGLVTARGAPYLRRPGGLPIVGRGKFQGSIGVRGASTDQQDEDCARAGVMTLDFSTASRGKKISSEE